MEISHITRKSHHRRHKIGVGNFPGTVRPAAVRFVPAAFYDDNGMSLIFMLPQSSAAGLGFSLRERVLPTQ